MTAQTQEIVERITAAAKELADAREAEQELEDNRINVKLRAIEKIMRSGDNSLTGKPHSFSSAEAAVGTDAEYQDYLAQQRAATRRTILARGDYEAARAVAVLTARADA